MSCWGTRAQGQHLALEPLGRGWCGKSPSGAEVGRRPVMGGPARGRGGWPSFELAFSRAGSAGPPRRALLQGPARHRRGGWEFWQAQLHGRRLSRPALEVLGPGRRERSDRRTRRVAVASTCDTIGLHVGRRFSCPQAAPAALPSEARSELASGGDRDRSGNRSERQRVEIAADSPGRRHRPIPPVRQERRNASHEPFRSANTPEAHAAALASTSP